AVVRESSQAPVHAQRCQVIVSTSSPHVGPALDALRQEGLVRDQKLSGTPAEAAALATGALCRGEADLAILLTDQPELAACLANRNGQVRAASAADVPSVERVRKSMQANLLSVDVTGRSVSELKSMLKAFVTHP